MDSVVDFDSMYKCSIHFASTKRKEKIFLLLIRGMGLLWGGRLTCNEKFRWVRIPYAPVT